MKVHIYRMPVTLRRGREKRPCSAFWLDSEQGSEQSRSIK